MEKANESKENNNSPVNSGMRTLVNVDLYLKNGIHIGTKYKNGAMRRFIFKSRSDKLNVMDVQIIDKRIKIAIDFISKYNPSDIMFVSRKKYALFGLKLLEKNFGYNVKVDRFIPGTFTNPESEHFTEPKMVFIIDPNIDRQAIVEAKKIRAPIAALSTTSSNVRDIDLIIPFNNKGRKSVALFFWLLNRELMIMNGLIKSEAEYAYKIEDFVYTLSDDSKDDKEMSRNSSRFGSSRFSRPGGAGTGFGPRRQGRFERLEKSVVN